MSVYLIHSSINEKYFLNRALTLRNKLNLFSCSTLKLHVSEIYQESRETMSVGEKKRSGCQMHLTEENGMFVPALNKVLSVYIPKP